MRFGDNIIPAIRKKEKLLSKEMFSFLEDEVWESIYCEIITIYDNSRFRLSIGLASGLWDYVKLR